MIIIGYEKQEIKGYKWYDHQFQKVICEKM
jgi:hypothetical protein